MRYFWCLVYYSFARWLPESTSLGGNIAKRVRGFLGSRLLAECGRDVNIERSAHFGSGRQVRLGSRSGIGSNARLIGPVTIGDDVMMGPRVTILTRNHAFADTTRPMIEQGPGGLYPVAIGDDVWIGMSAIILPGVTIERGAVVGAGAVVTKNIPAYAIAVGNPARVIKSRLGNGEALDVP